jgi:phosphoenolpyruvate carboxylase
MEDSFKPLNPETFSKELNAIRFPKEGVIRKPIEWLVILKEIPKDIKELNDQAVFQARTTLSSYLKLLQKHYSDMIMTTRILKFTDEEKKLWSSEREKLLYRIVENYSIMEMITVFPTLTKANKDGKLEFDLSAFSAIAKQTEDGQIYFDEYLLQEELEKQKKLKEDNKDELEVVKIKEIPTS